jgi:gluconokinase
VIIILMGMAGAGKTTVGRALAIAARWPFYDADDFHDAGNIERMRAGVGLTDRDRGPWLARIHAVMIDVANRGDNAVVACSALKQKYRDALADNVPDVRWVYLRGEPDLLRDRLVSRVGHYAGPALIETQLADLEPPANALVLAVERPVHRLVAEICSAFCLECEAESRNSNINVQL